MRAFAQRQSPSTARALLSRAPCAPATREAIHPTPSREEMKTAPATPPASHHFDLTRTPLAAKPIQRKAAISAPGDAFEREADAVAERVMQMDAASPINSAPAAIQRKCAACEEDEEKVVQTKPALAVNVGAVPDSAAALRATRQSGVPLPRDVRAYFEPRFGHDFSRVRVHAGTEAASGARAVQARAYTVGHDIVFGSGQYAPATTEGKRLLAHELTHVIQQESAPSLAQSPQRSPLVAAQAGAPVIQRKDDPDCNLDHLDKECGGAAASCLTVKDYCAKTYPTSKEIDTLHANAIKGAKEYKAKYPNAADNLLHFLDGSGTEKVMKLELFRDDDATKNKYGDHMAKFREGAKKRYEKGELKVGGPGVKMVWTDTANAFSMSGYTDLGLAVGGYTLCSKVTAKALDPKEVGGSSDYLHVRFDPWTVQAFDCYNWDPGKGIGLPFATDSDLCCLENAGKAKHFRVRTDPWTAAFPIEDIRITPEKASETPKAPPPPKKKDDGDR